MMKRAVYTYGLPAWSLCPGIMMMESQYGLILNQIKIFLKFSHSIFYSQSLKITALIFHLLNYFFLPMTIINWNFRIYTRWTRSISSIRKGFSFNHYLDPRFNNIPNFSLELAIAYIVSWLSGQGRKVVSSKSKIWSSPNGLIRRLQRLRLTWRTGRGRSDNVFLINF